MKNKRPLMFDFRSSISVKDAEEPQQNNYRNRDTDQPEENTAHRGFLFFAGAPPTNVWTKVKFQ